MACCLLDLIQFFLLVAHLRRISTETKLRLGPAKLSPLKAWWAMHFSRLDEPSTTFQAEERSTPIWHVAGVDLPYMPM